MEELAKGMGITLVSARAMGKVKSEPGTTYQKLYGL